MKECDRLPNGHTRMVLSDAAHIQRGSVLMFRTTEMVRSRVVQISQSVVELEDTMHVPLGTIGGVWSMQTTLVLEMIKNDAPKSSETTA